MTDDSLEICPECGGHIRRVYYPAGIVFKGSGFYKTDHRSPPNGANSNGHSSGKEDTSTGTDTATTSNETKTSGESKATGTETSSKSSPPSENKVAAGK